jgi:integrase
MMTKREPNRRRLTDLAVARLKEPGLIWDAALPGFGVRVGARTKVWVVAIRRPGALHPVRLKVGRYPDMGLADARAAARRMMESGAPAAPTNFKDVLEAFLQHGRTKKGREVRQSTAHQYRRNLGSYAVRLHNRPIQDIGRREVAELIGGIATGSGAPTASLIRSMLSRLFGWAVEVGYIDVNPVTGTPGYEIRKRSRVLSDAEIRALWQATKATTDFNLAVRLCLWCGVRRSEAGGARRSEFEDGIWRIPEDRVKNGRELVLPVAQQTLAAIAAWPTIAGRDHLFGARSTVGFNSWGDAKARLDTRLKFNRPFVLHDLRRTCETRLAQLGVIKEIRSRILNHDVGNLEDSYQHHDFRDEKAQALQLWANEIDRINCAE